MGWESTDSGKVYNCRVAGNEWSVKCVAIYMYVAIILVYTMHNLTGIPCVHNTAMQYIVSIRHAIYTVGNIDYNILYTKSCPHIYSFTSCNHSGIQVHNAVTAVATIKDDHRSPCE